MARNSPTKAELEAQIKLMKAADRSSGWAAITKHFFTCGAFCFIAYMMFLSVQVLAGRTTSANILVNFIGSITTSTGVSLAAGVSGVSYGLLERRRRKKDAARYAARNKELEKQIDKRRSSSLLTEAGDTNPQDKE